MKLASIKPVRCAIYTRVSTEHGLDQEFNSLDAQYDAASAYIKSQAHAGWALIRSRYDDGGYSGGSTDRPDLQRLARPRGTANNPRLVWAIVEVARLQGRVNRWCWRSFRHASAPALERCLTSPDYPSCFRKAASPASDTLTHLGSGAAPGT